MTLPCPPHYYADQSGGFGWPSCVKCGAPVSIEESHALRLCCKSRENAEHATACLSLDAKRRREATLT